MSESEVNMWADRMTARLSRKRRTRTDADLAARAARLSREYFGGELLPGSVQWSEQQNSRWGSCTVTTGAIRISARMREFPSWVVDYVLLHEIAHLRYGGHGPRFWSLVSRYPLTERARGYLIAKGGDVEADQP